jgi:hypothetical protein
VNDTRHDEVEAYVTAVAGALADLPGTDRDDLLEDLPQHLTEVLSEEGGPLADRLGSPEAYAAELRATLGAGSAAGRRRVLLDGVRQRLGDLDARTGPLFGTELASTFLSTLRPGWWVLRGYVAAMLLAVMFDDGSRPLGVLPRVGGSLAVAVLLLTGCVLLSVLVGRRSAGLAGWPRFALHSSTVFLAIAAAAGVAVVDDSTRRDFHQDVYRERPPLSDVRDLFVYDGDRLLTGVRVYDQDGNPVTLPTGNCLAEPDRQREPVAGVYPACPARAPLGPSAPWQAPSPSAATPSPSAVTPSQSTAGLAPPSGS